MPKYARAAAKSEASSLFHSLKASLNRSERSVSCITGPLINDIQPESKEVPQSGSAARLSLKIRREIRKGIMLLSDPLSELYF
jgi:hypothetical protein